MSVLTSLGAGALTGNHPGYAVTFHEVNAAGAVTDAPALTLHSDVVEAEISASLSGDVQGGSATIAFAGLTDTDHQALAERTADGAARLAAARVHLFWRDTNRSVGGYLTSLLGIGALTAGLGAQAAASGQPLADVRVADLTVTGVSRRRGTRRYETVVTGTDRVAVAATARLRDPLGVDGLETAARRLAELANVEATMYPVDPVDPAVHPGEIRFTAVRGERIREALLRLATRWELVTGRYGRGLLLVRDGALHVGVRPIPLRGDPPALTYVTGLLSVEALPALVLDADSAESGVKPPRRDQWLVQLRGRPDLRPGDVVTFDPPPGEGTVQPDLAAALVGAFAAPLTGLLGEGTSARGYVTGVRHTLSRSSGFLTELTVVGLTSGEDGWDRHTAATTAAAVSGDGGPPADHPDPVVALRAQLEDGVQRRMATLEIADVGEVRAHRPAAAGDSPGQRITLWQGTDPASDGAGHGAVRLPIDRAAPLEKTNVPYATPFAWGRYGLVLPRYPGTRVVSVHRHGQPDDPVEVGAVWPDGEGPDAEAGDWWLSLPASVPPGERAAAPDGAVPAPPAGKATNDLVDADGHRVIEAGNLRVRIGRGGLADAGTRPAAAPDDVVLSIEHADGTTLLEFTGSGDVRLVAKGKLILSGTAVQIEAREQDVEMSGTNVKVAVQEQMKVE